MGLLLLEFLGLFATVVFLTYVGLILVPFVRRRPTMPGDATQFEWHMFIPARDEQAVIGETIMRTRRGFPDAHVWVIDDDSDDDTVAVVEAIAERDDRVHLVRRCRPHAREGKGPALNAGYVALRTWLPRRTDRSRVIVGVLDADGRLAPDALAYIASDSVFGAEEVGAAQVAVRMENRHSVDREGSLSRLGARFSHVLVRMQDMEFMTTMSAMQLLREHTGSVGLGGNGQFSRLSVLDDIALSYGAPWHGALLEDYELGLHVLLTGHRNRFIYDTYVEQEGLPSLRRLITQRTRWTQGTMQCASYLGAVMRSPHLSNAAVVESSYFLITPWFQVFGVFVWPALLAATVASALTYAGGVGMFVSQFWPLALITLLFGLAPFILWGPIYRMVAEPGLSRLKAWGLGFANVCYVYYTYITTLRALGRVVSGRRNWAKTRHNAETATQGVRPGNARDLVSSDA